MEASWVFVHHSDWIHWFSYVHKQTTKKYIYKCPYVNILQTRTRTLILSISLLSLSVSSLPVQETIQENQICPRSYWQTLWEAWVLNLTYRFSSKNALLHLLTREYNGHVGMEIPATENLLRQNFLISRRQASRSQSIWETESLCAFYPSPASRLDLALSSQPEYLFQGTGKGLRLHTKIYGFAKKQKIVAVLLVV